MSHQKIILKGRCMLYVSIHRNLTLSWNGLKTWWCLIFIECLAMFHYYGWEQNWILLIWYNFEYFYSLYIRLGTTNFVLAKILISIYQILRLWLQIQFQLKCATVPDHLSLFKFLICASWICISIFVHCWCSVSHKVTSIKCYSAMMHGNGKQSI